MGRLVPGLPKAHTPEQFQHAGPPLAVRPNKDGFQEEPKREPSEDPSPHWWELSPHQS
jgi:hypothetical protein